MSEELKQYIIDNFIGNGGNLSEEWWFDFFIGAGLKGLSLGPYEVTTIEK